MKLLFAILKLIPYIAISVALTYFLVKIPQVGEYLLYYGEKEFNLELGLRYFLIAIFYFILWFLIGKSIQSIAKNGDILVESRYWKIFIFIIFIILL